MATKKPDNLEISTTNSVGQAWKFDLATQKWELTYQGKTMQGDDPVMLARNMDKELKKELKKAPKPTDFTPSEAQAPTKAVRFAVRVKNSSTLGLSGQSPDLSIIQTAINPHHKFSFEPHYQTRSGKHIGFRSDLPIIDPQFPDGCREVVRTMLFNKIIELTEKPAQVAAQRWWSSKETTTITANGPATTLGSPWPTAEPSKEKWSSDGAGGLQLGKASITLGELQGIDVPVFCLNYEGLGQVLRGAFAMPDILQQLGASLHAMFDKSIPTEGVKTWIANTGWHKNPQGKGYPAEFEVFFSTVLDIPQMEGGPAPFMLKRSSDGTLCFRSLRSEMLRSTLDVRSSEPGDRQFLEQVRQVAGIATKAFSAATASDGPFNKEQVALQMAFKTDPQAPAEEILAATKKWIEDVDAFIDSHPTITALREKTAPMVEAINAYLPAEPSPAAADPVSQRRPRAR